MSDRYAADRVIPARPLLTPTHSAIIELWAKLRYSVSQERTCLRAYRQADGSRIGYLAQLSEDDGQALRRHLQAKWDADQALAQKEATP